MRYHAAYTSRFPIRLLFADGCLICLPTRAGLILNGVLTPGYVHCPKAVDSLCTGYSQQNVTLLSVCCQKALKKLVPIILEKGLAKSSQNRTAICS